MVEVPDNRAVIPPEESGSQTESTSPPTAAPRALDLEFSRRGDRSFLTRRLFRWPYEVGILTHGQNPDIDSGTASLIVQSATSGLITGERIRQRLVVRDGGRVRVFGQGAMPVQMSRPGGGSAEDLELRVGASSRLEYVAEPRLLFPGSSYSQVTRTEVEPGGDLVLTDAVVRHPDPGPVTYSSEIRLDYGGERVAIERMGFAEADRGLFSASALVLAVGVGVAERDWAPWLSRHASPVCYGAVSPLRGCPGVSVRVVAEDGRLLRDAVGEALRELAPR